MEEETGAENNVVVSKAEKMKRNRERIRLLLPEETPLDTSIGRSELKFLRKGLLQKERSFRFHGMRSRASRRSEIDRQLRERERFFRPRARSRHLKSFLFHLLAFVSQ